MTPDEVVTRARELVGQEVLFTMRGVVHPEYADNPGTPMFKTSGYTLCLRWGGKPVAHLVDIQPAPMRIEAGQLYRNSAGELLRGDADGGLTGFDGYIPPDAVRHDSDLKPVKVVDA